MTVAVD